MEGKLINIKERQLSLLQEENAVIKSNIDKMKNANKNLQIKVEIKNNKALRVTDIYKVKIPQKSQELDLDHKSPPTIRKTVLSKGKIQKINRDIPKETLTYDTSLPILPLVTRSYGVSPHSPKMIPDNIYTSMLNIKQEPSPKRIYAGQMFDDIKRTHKVRNVNQSQQFTMPENQDRQMPVNGLKPKFQTRKNSFSVLPSIEKPSDDYVHSNQLQKSQSVPIFKPIAQIKKQSRNYSLEVQKIKRIQLATLKQKQKDMKSESMRIEDVIKKAKVLSRAPSHQRLAKGLPQMEQSQSLPGIAGNQITRLPMIRVDVNKKDRYKLKQIVAQTQPHSPQRSDSTQKVDVDRNIQSGEELEKETMNSVAMNSVQNSQSLSALLGSMLDKQGQRSDLLGSIKNAMHAQTQQPEEKEQRPEYWLKVQGKNSDSIKKKVKLFDFLQNSGTRTKIKNQTQLVSIKKLQQDIDRRIKKKQEKIMFDLGFADLSYINDITADDLEADEQ